MLQINVGCTTIPLLHIVCKCNLKSFDDLTKVKMKAWQLKRKEKGLGEISGVSGATLR